MRMWQLRRPRFSISIISSISFRSFAKSKKPVWGSAKEHRRIKLVFGSYIMGDSSNEGILAPYRASVKEQGDLVRHLKLSNAPELDIKKAIAELKIRKKNLDDKELELMPASAFFDRAKMEDLLKRRFYYDQSFSIYGGITGLYDYGPIGCALKTNILNQWRKFFVLKEQMFEIDCSILTPEPVLKLASGHVERFADLMVKDTANGECFRLDHLVKAHLEKLCCDKKLSQDKINEYESLISRLDGFNRDELQEIVVKFGIKSPLTGNTLTEPIEFNLMFETRIGPAGLHKGYLRPETAQGIFVNFKRLLEFNQGKLPFAAAQIGNAFRNEISPRSGLIRVREFTMAEIEHFCDPNDKTHPKFQTVENVMLTMYSACNQMDGKPAERLTIGEAVRNNTVANESLGYFIARICQFMLSIGIDEKRLRFRQHLSNEMAHYACDCWDAECLTSYGWIECVGCADRSAYDLTQHFQATGVRLVAEKRLPQAITVDVKKAVPNKGILGKIFKDDMRVICQKLDELSINDIESLEETLRESGEYILSIKDATFKLTSEMVVVKELAETRHVEEVTPNVIEPSFGIGRIMYSLFEHNFLSRDNDPGRTFFSLLPHIAPIKCSVLPLSSNDEFVPLTTFIANKLEELIVPYKVDDSAGSIGKRYTRSDELSIPFNVTVDFDSLKEPNTVTLRERDSTEQLRILVSDIPQIVKQLADRKLTWEQVSKMYPKFDQQEATKQK